MLILHGIHITSYHLARIWRFKETIATCLMLATGATLEERFQVLANVRRGNRPGIHQNRQSRVTLRIGIHIL